MLSKLTLAVLALAAASASAAEAPKFPAWPPNPAAMYKSKNATKLMKDDGPLGEVWDKVAAWKDEYLAKKNATVAKLVATKKKAPPATTQPPTDVLGDAAAVDAPAVPKPAAAPKAAVGNAYAVRFMKADLPPAIKAELTAEAAAKGMQTVVEGED